MSCNVENNSLVKANLNVVFTQLFKEKRQKAKIVATFTYDGYESLHLFKKFVFTEFQVNFNCCAGKRN